MTSTKQAEKIPMMPEHYAEFPSAQAIAVPTTLS